MANLIRRHSRLILNRILFNNYSKVCRNSPLNPRVRCFHTTLNLNKIVSFNLSDIGEGIREVTVKEWYIKEGDTVEQFDNICEVQSDKASVTITSRYDGKIAKIHHKVDDVALVGKPLLDFQVEDEEGESSSSSSESSSDDESVSSNKKAESKEVAFNSIGKVLATPAVRRIAMENNVDLKKITPTGNGKRVLKGDVLEYLNMIPRGTVKPHPTLVAAAVLLNTTTTGSNKKIATPVADRVEELKGVKKAMFKSMSEALKIPHFAYSDEIDMTNLVNLRDEIKGEALNRGIKITFMPFTIKAASIALQKFPILNSSIDEKTESIIYKSAHNISVAMDTPHGLVVPNVKNCQDKSIFEIAQELTILQEKGQKGMLRPEDFANGTFSLSNIGVVGGTYTHPCIMAPQVSIGAMGRTKVLPRFGKNDEIVRAHIMHVSWSADHRIIDGVTMASFSNLWKKYLETPSLFLLDGH